MNQTRRAVLSGACLGALGLFYGEILRAQTLSSSRKMKKERVIKIEAKKFVYTPNLITLKVNESVMLEIHSIDFIHGFKMPDFNIRVDLIPGQIIKIPLHPTQAGRYEFLCDNFCGDGHEEMNGTIVVTA